MGYDDIDEMTPDDWSRLQTFGESLYTSRLNNIGPYLADDIEERTARLWASACMAEMMCVLECVFGHGKGISVAQAMLDANEVYTGPRMKRVRT